MPGPSAIEWTQATWNPVTGCDKVSPGCAHCYAETFAERWRGIPGHPYEQGFDLKLWPERLEIPLRWRKPRMIFVNSMSDLFHERVPGEFINRVWMTMRNAPQHTYQILTKRPERLLEWTEVAARVKGWPVDEIWPPWVWLGVSIENRRFVHRADVLREGGWEDEYEGPGLYLNEIDWLIAGGESGPHHRAVRPEWIRALRDATRLWDSDEVTQLDGRFCAFFFKQWGGRYPTSGGRELDGRTWDEMPRVKERAE